jgi:hypothetical protein
MTRLQRAVAVFGGLLLLPLVAVPRAEAGILPLPCDPTGLIGDCTPPDTQLTSTPADPTTLTNASFTFTTPESGATFECQLSGPSKAHLWQDCTGTPASGGSSDGTQSYSGLVPGSYDFQVRATDSVGNTDQTPADFTWTIDTTDPSTPPPDDPNAPDTTLTYKPRYWHLFTYASFEYTSDQAADHFVCTLDGSSVDCPNDGLDIYPGGITYGTHTFKVAAVNSSGSMDQTPATVTFTRPLTVHQIRKWSKAWTLKSGHGHFADYYAVAKRRGAWAQSYNRGAYRVAIIATKCPKCGKIDVYWKNEFVKQVNLHANKRHKRRVIPIARFRNLTGGRLKVEIASKGKPVILEGYGFSTTR